MKLVLLHGWGMHAGIWGDWTKDFQACALDLPGHGRRPRPETMGSLAELAADAVATVDQPAVWLGWSLGGLVAMRAALDFPERVQALVLVGCSASFVGRDDWPCGMDPAVFRGFAEGLKVDHRATLNRFTALEVHGSEGAREHLAEIRRRMHQCAPPAPAALHQGLALLEHTDLRAALARIPQATLLIGGERDRLVSPAAIAATATLLPRAAVAMIPGAGHAPFLSHAHAFTALLRRFMENPADVAAA